MPREFLMEGPNSVHNSDFIESSSRHKTLCNMYFNHNIKIEILNCLEKERKIIYVIHSPETN